MPDGRRGRAPKKAVGDPSKPATWRLNDSVDSAYHGVCRSGNIGKCLTFSVCRRAR